jgi:thymidylate synthase (FAD)
VNVTFIGGTFANIEIMMNATGGEWSPNWEEDDDTSLGELLVEFAARSCYQSWSKPSPDRQNNKDYIAHILKVGHFSVLRHATATAYITGVSRSLTHELIRHHVGIDFSQLSQRYVDSAQMTYVVPPAMRGDEQTEDRLRQHWLTSVRNYEAEVMNLEAQGKTRKQAREAARAFLPNCAETKIVVTANIQAWRNFVLERGTEHADAEIRELAVEVARQLKEAFTGAFQDIEICEGGDGITTVTRRPL